MNKKIYWTAFRFIVPLTIIGLVVVFLTYNKPHKNFDRSQPEFTIGSKDLIVLYQDNADNAKSLVTNVAPIVEADKNSENCTCKFSLENAIITSPEMRDKNLVKKLEVVAGRLLNLK